MTDNPGSLSRTSPSPTVGQTARRRERTMGFRQAAVLVPVCFFLGIFYICFNVDHRILWQPLTEDVLSDGFQFYTTFFNSPPAIKALLHGMVGVGLLGLLAKLHKWDESAMFFDGSSLAVYVFGIVIYLTVTVPTLRTIVTPVEGVDTQEDRIEAMRVLSAGNVMIALALGGILVLQAGQEYARRSEAKALAKMEEEQQKKIATSKKNQ